MKLLVVRHAIAEEGALGQLDAARRLTVGGRRKMRRGVKGLRRLVDSIDVLGCSPLVRAVETAAILCDVFRDLKFVVVPALEPGRALTDVLDWIRQQGARETVALVGHEPQLGLLVSWLLNGDGAGDARAVVELRKGSACLLEFSSEITAGRGKLLWLLKPSQLRKLGR